MLCDRTAQRSKGYFLALRGRTACLPACLHLEQSMQPEVGEASTTATTATSTCVRKRSSGGADCACWIDSIDSDPLRATRIAGFNTCVTRFRDFRPWASIQRDSILIFSPKPETATDAGAAHARPSKSVPKTRRSKQVITTKKRRHQSQLFFLLFPFYTSLSFPISSTSHHPPHQRQPARAAPGAGNLCFITYTHTQK